MKQKAPVISAVDLKVIEYLNRYGCLTVRQLCRIFDWKDYSHAAGRMRKLEAFKYVEHKPLPFQGIGGVTLMYKNASEGEAYIKKEKGIIPHRFVMGSGKILTPVWWHTKATQDFFVTAETWVSQQKKLGKDIAIEKMATEFDLKRDKEHFPPNSSILIPDGWIDIRDMERRRRYCFLLEVETGTQFPTVVREKIKKHLLFADRHYEAIFGTRSLKRLWIAMDGEDHRKMILRTMAEVLREEGREEETERFLVTATKPDETAIFTEQVWYYPGTYTALGLFD